jgi:predicted amidohydrolase YtcJ
MSETYQLPLQFPSSEGGEYGFEYFGNEDTLKNVATSLSNSGFQLHFHVTGDRGAKLALNAIEVSNQSSGPHRLTHCYLVAEADHGRFQELNAVADFQLASSSVNLDYEEYIAGVIGTNRTDQLLPAVSILNTGAVVTLSSDWDADELSPLSKLKTVLTRPGDGKAIPNLAAALRMYTLNPAILLNHDDKTGTIEVGKLADLAVVDKNLFELPVEQLDSAKIVATFLEGKPVYDPQGVFGDSLGTMPPDGVSRMFDSQIGWMVGFVIWVSYLLV